MKFLHTSICAIALATSATFAAPAMAQMAEDSLHAGAIEVPANKSRVVSADRPIGKALIGNADIADVLPISERSVYLLGKSFGTTSLTLYDRTNHVIAVMDVAVGPDVESLSAQIAELVPGQHIDAHLSNGSIVLSGMVNDAGAADRVAQLAKGFAGDKVINLVTLGSSQQVMLEVRFAEIDRQSGEKLGLRASGLSVGGSFGFAIGDALGTAAPDAFGSISKSFNIGDTSIDATLDLLERKGLSKTLAEPTLVALSGEKASFLAGGEFPIPVDNSNRASGDVSIEYKSFGVSLGFTPTVLADNVINLLVEPEVSSLDPSASVSVNGIVVPGLQTRRVSTTVELRDGESFAIAGLLRRDFQTTVRQVPLLGSIPIIGALFRSSSFQKGETELLIVVTPHLVAPIRADQVRLPTDRIRDPEAIDVLIDGEGYHPQPLAPQSGTAPAVPAEAAPQAKEKGYEF